jgi:hypothetical protein
MVPSASVLTHSWEAVYFRLLGLLIFFSFICSFIRSP